MCLLKDIVPVPKCLPECTSYWPGLPKDGLSFGKPESGFRKLKSGFGKPGLSFGKLELSFGKLESGFGKPGLSFGKLESSFGQLESS